MKQTHEHTLYAMMDPRLRVLLWFVVLCVDATSAMEVNPSTNACTHTHTLAFRCGSDDGGGGGVDI